MSQTHSPLRPTVSSEVGAERSRGTLTWYLEKGLGKLDLELETTPFLRALRNGSVTRESYVHLLQELLIMHRAVERGLGLAHHLRGLNQRAFLREEELRRDLRIMRGRVPVRTSDHVDHFESLVHGWVKPPCMSLVGAVYVFERERYKSVKLVRPLAQALEVKVAPRHGLDYYLEQSGEHSRRFAIFRDQLDSRVRDVARAREVVDGALETMRTRIEIYREAG